MPLTPDDLGDLAQRLSVTPATARRMLRVAVTLPDGRQVHGQPSGAAGATLEEHRLRDDLARRVRGITEACLPYGRADVMTASVVFEVETAAKWRQGIRQVLAYSAQCGLDPALALFGQAHRDEVLKMYLRLRDGRPPVQLWWHSGYGWQRIASRRECRNMEAAAGPRTSQP